MSQSTITVGIVGGAGYTAGELLRLLLPHPQATIGAVVSSTQAGQPVHSVHDDLLGDTDLTFASELRGDEDVVFLCLGHGNSREWLLKTALPPRTKVIDLSNDFRLAADRKAGGREFVYGLPELNRAAIRAADSVAAGRGRAAARGGARVGQHGQHGRGARAGRNDRLHLAHRQHLDLQNLHAPALGRNWRNAGRLAAGLRAPGALHPLPRQFYAGHLRLRLYYV